jgi:metal-responsive CopG/Arc/MetJ family transcriptional regulator
MCNTVEGIHAMRVIQVPMDEGLLKAVNEQAKSRRSTRSALIRAACQEYLDRIEQQALERKYVEGYRRTPESPLVGKLGEKMAREVWPEEAWDEAW